MQAGQKTPKGKALEESRGKCSSNLDHVIDGQPRALIYTETYTLLFKHESICRFIMTTISLDDAPLMTMGSLPLFCVFSGRDGADPQGARARLSLFCMPAIERLSEQSVLPHPERRERESRTYTHTFRYAGTLPSPSGRTQNYTRLLALVCVQLSPSLVESP